MFLDALSLDIVDAWKLLKTKYPRAQFTGVLIYSPKKFEGRVEQPYWIFLMTKSTLWSSYLWVGVRDWSVSSSEVLPQSVMERNGQGLIELY